MGCSGKSAFSSVKMLFSRRLRLFMPLRRVKNEIMNTPIVGFVFLVCTFNSWAAPTPLSFNDPIGDDFGNGSLIYPQRADFQVGDLDLRRLQIGRDAHGFWFAATFRNKILDPKEISNSSGPESLAYFARNGFYQFNIDIYIDTDRFNGSGNTVTLPGRHIKIAPGFAWERAVILTPRPELMRHQLIDVLTEQFPAQAVADMEASVDQSILFPTRIRVRGKTIEFFVPATFFTGCEGESWATTTFVTGAITSVTADFSLINSDTKPLDRIPLGVLQPVPGHAKDSFGFGGDVMPSPVIDLLAESAQSQREQLVGPEGLQGAVWEIGGELPFIPAAVASSKTVHPVGKYLQADAAIATPSSSATVAPAPIQPESSAERSLSNRLQILQKLFDQGLINEEDYRQQKQRILQAL